MYRGSVQCMCMFVRVVLYLDACVCWGQVSVQECKYLVLVHTPIPRIKINPTYMYICMYVCTYTSTGKVCTYVHTVEPLYRGHYWDPAGCPV